MLTVRDANAPDLPQIRHLLLELPVVPETELGDDARALQAFDEILEQRGHTILVIEDDGTIVGTLVLLIVPGLTHDAAPWAMIENFVVASGRRSEGIGHQLLANAVERAAEAGCYKVQLMSDNARPDAHRFYRAFGFEPRAQGFRLYL